MSRKFQGWCALVAGAALASLISGRAAARPQGPAPGPGTHIFDSFRMQAVRWQLLEQFMMLAEIDPEWAVENAAALLGDPRILGPGTHIYD